MTKILISPLGTGTQEDNSREYKTATYNFEGEETYETSFVTAALSQYLKVDKLFLIGTGKSMWEEVYNYYKISSYNPLDEDYWLELGEKINNSNYETCLLTEEDLIKVSEAVDEYLQQINSGAEGGSSCFLIDYGIKEEEIWSNFDVFMQIFDQLKPGDEIYLDITHSFRSIPLFMYLIMDFMQNLQQQDLELSGIFYGMLEARQDLGYAPVVDLKPLFKISRWIRGVYDFITYGNGYIISNLLDDEELSSKIRNISDLININYLVDLKKQIDSLHELIKNKDFSKMKVLKYVLPHIEEFVNRFSRIESEAKFQREMAYWNFINKRYASGYICLLESVLTGLCELYELNSTDKDNRDLMKTLLRNYKFQHSKLKKLAEKYETINQIRIDAAHAAHTRKSSSFASDINQGERYYGIIKDIFESGNLENLPEQIPIKKLE